jgi:D-tyrosyl-tRNA(Tyr) deacylase
MRVVVQRVTSAAVRVDNEDISRIRHGLLVLVGFTNTDNDEVLQWMAHKVATLRVFEDSTGRMNLDLEAVGGEMLVVSQFTLYGDCSKGTRPSFDKSAPADLAELLYDRFLELLEQETPRPVLPGAFQQHMEVELVNDGPVTIVLDKEAG